MFRVVHVSHEAVRQIGGIGSVLQGLLTSRAYREGVERTILLGPLSDPGGPPLDRLGPGGQVDYSSLDGLYGGPHPEAFRFIEQQHGVRLVHGHRILVHPETREQVPVEVVLVDVRTSWAARLNFFKFRLWSRFGLASSRHDVLWEYELYLRLAEPGYEVLRLLLGHGGPNIFVAHEFMGLPTALKVLLERDPNCRTVFHAHEVATARLLTESLPGHDTMFYNVLRAARSEGLSLEQVFGLQDHFFKHALVRLAHQCHAIFAVGDLIVEELRFLSPEFQGRSIDCVYNGVPALPLSWEERCGSRSRLQAYANTLLGFRPDIVFSHVARPVLSKALWRDLQVLVRLDPLLHRAGRRAVFFILASQDSARRPEKEVLEMERSYRWPIHHRLGWPDLFGSEVVLNDAVEAFNLGAHAVRIVYVNQFGWNRTSCGLHMPEEMEFRDLRRGTDAEFGLSIYEPFGIAQLEPLTFGAISLISSVCGCRGFLERVGGLDSPSVLVGDYTRLGGPKGRPEDYLRVDRRTRDRVEALEGQRLAQELVRRLSLDPKEQEQRLARGYELASRMSWEVVAREQFIPGLRGVGFL